ncbi:MAG: LysR family transcriptional regulator [Bauldia sp.]|nr:LysR family transcriptional regulator [Bauldia sp.]
MKNIASVDLNLLVAFDAMMRERNVTRAAARIGLAQPSMSNALSRLRALFDDELFVRTPGGMRPTPRAEKIGVEVSAALEAVDRAVNDDARFDPATARFTVRLATTDYVEYVVLPEVIRQLREKAPHCHLLVGPFGREVVPTQLDRGDIDLAIGRPESIAKRHRGTVLFHEDFICIAREGHPAIGADLDLDTFLALPHALVSQRGDGVGVVDAVLAEQGLKRSVVYSAASFVTLPFVVSDSDLIAVVPRRLAEQASKAVPLEMRPVPIALPGFDLSMIWDKGTDGAPAHRWLRELVIDTVGGVPRGRSRSRRNGL